MIPAEVSSIRAELLENVVDKNSKMNKVLEESYQAVSPKENASNTKVAPRAQTADPNEMLYEECWEQIREVAQLLQRFNKKK